MNELVGRWSDRLLYYLRRQIDHDQPATYWLGHRIEQAELNTREELLQLELRIAEWSEKHSTAK